MIAVDYTGQAVVVTGGTRGLGKALGLAFARAGATVFLTHRWGSVAGEAIADEFAREQLPAPHVIECDVADREASRDLMAAVRASGLPLRTIISNVAFAKVVRELDDMRRESFDLSLHYSAWPVVDLVQAAQEVLGYYPRYVVAISSDGATLCPPNYDFAGTAKAALEALCRYLALRLRPHDSRVNVIRCGLLDTESYRATAGDAAAELHKQLLPIFLEPADVARACLALCSGLMDVVTGTVLVADEGWSLVHPTALVTGHAKGFPRKTGTADDHGA